VLRLLSRWFLAELTSSALKMEAICFSETSWTLNGLHGVISQKMVLFITTAVKTSNPTHIELVHGKIFIRSVKIISDA
jgi:hypothetical protein